ncbi:MAG TPA: c-type cytochrome [Terriglobales bacterium]|nr:c-type cytochrome [Terriglobales bacterium]
MDRPRVILGIPIVIMFIASIACSSPQSTRAKTSSTNTPSGAELYAAYCATCHGADGKGNGPTAPALKVRPPDLTVLAKRSRGRFPEGDVYQIIKWGGGIIGHGSKEMPVWGTAFKSASDETEVNSRIKALTQYIESIQAR